MKVDVAPGKYVVAVSGGVDSMVLLDVLRQKTGLELVVAHFDHGIREDSDRDRQLVQHIAEQHGLQLVFAEGQLGPRASEATARAARYAFLHEVMQQHGALAIITAHHQDDLIETAILNLLRGTGRKGLSALGTQPDVLRPFLHLNKADIHTYAQRHHLHWREDSTNRDEKYLRNYIRAQLVPKLGEAGRTRLLGIIEAARASNQVLDQLLAEMLGATPTSLSREWFIGLPHTVAREVMAAWLRTNGVRDFDKPTIERLVMAAKTATPGKRANVRAGVWLLVTPTSLALN